MLLHAYVTANGEKTQREHFELLYIYIWAYIYDTCVCVYTCILRRVDKERCQCGVAIAIFVDSNGNVHQSRRCLIALDKSLRYLLYIGRKCSCKTLACGAQKTSQRA